MIPVSVEAVEVSVGLLMRVPFHADPRSPTAASLATPLGGSMRLGQCPLRVSIDARPLPRASARLVRARTFGARAP